MRRFGRRAHDNHHMDPETLAALEQMYDEQMAPVIAMLEQSNAEYCAMMRPFWDEQEREAAELAEVMAEMSEPITPAWFD